MTEAFDTPSRFIIGVDLGTTNCSAAFVDTGEAAWTVRDFAIPQFTAPDTVESLLTLPSFLYRPAEGELPGSAIQTVAGAIVGVLAREQGASAPGRLISSAKSWLCHGGIDRTAAILPWQGAADVPRLSPVDASSAFLSHIRAAWDKAHADHPLADQEVILTVPASFDEVARELTVQAARSAGFSRLTLVEEPQAAFYAWISAQGQQWDRLVRPGQKILVCDIGGGTSDFTLIRVRQTDSGGVLFHRIAVGQHLLLGGDNLDLAIAHHIETRVSPGGRLGPREWGLLLRSARRLKETLLAPDAPERLTVNIATPGARLIGASKQIEITRQEVADLLLEGFLPIVGLDARPATRRSGFQEFNLPYAPDPGITRYLAQFLSAHRDVEPNAAGNLPLHADPARPDIVLFNGGFFESPLLRDRLLGVIRSWFSAGAETASADWQPQVLQSDRLDLAVSRGAAYYGTVRRGRGVRITGGLAHSYYIAVERKAAADSADSPAPLTALCLLPAGVEEGHSVEIERTFNLLIRQPVEFPLYVSATRTTDPPGALIEVDPEQFTPLPPIRTVLQSGRRSVADEVAVHLHARLTPIGTLELWAAEIRGERRWKLDFDVRSASRAEVAAHTGDAEAQGIVDASLLGPAAQLIREAFTKPSGSARKLPAPATPASLIKRLELLTGIARSEWPPSLMRSFWEATIDLADARALSPEHESRWLNFTGYCLRPGYGLAVDDWRVNQTWRLFSQKVVNPKNEQCRAEWWILWRRLAGGLSPGHQITLAEPLLAAMKSRLRPAGAIAQPKTSPFQYGAAESAEVWRTLGCLEHLKPALRTELAGVILDLLPREKSSAIASASLFALGRIGARVPVYAGLQSVLDPDEAESLVERLLALCPTLPPALLPTAQFTLVQLSRRTDDRYRDIAAPARQALLEQLQQSGAPAHYLELITSGGALGADEQRLAFGESLPKGLRID